MKDFSFDLALSLLAGAFVMVIILPMIALFGTISMGELIAQLRSPFILSAVVVSLETSVSVVLLALCLGVPVAYVLAMKDFKGKHVLDVLVTLPISMPPLVAGLALLLLLGSHSPLGGVLHTHGIEVLFSKTGIILAQLFVSMPFLIKSAREAFESIDKKLVTASVVLGASQLHTFRKILLPLAGKGICAGMVMTWARAMGEFGATSLIARPDRPTMPVAIGRFLSQPGAVNQGQALAMSTLLMLVCLVGFLSIERFRVGAIGEF